MILTELRHLSAFLQVSSTPPCCSNCLKSFLVFLFTAWKNVSCIKFAFCDPSFKTAQIKALPMQCEKLTVSRQLPVAFPSLKNVCYFPAERITESPQLWWEPHSSQSRGKAWLRACAPEEKSVLWSWCKQINLSTKGNFSSCSPEEKSNSPEQNVQHCLLHGTWIFYQLAIMYNANFNFTCGNFHLEPEQLWGKAGQGTPMPFPWGCSRIAAEELPNGNGIILPLPEGVTTALGQSNQTNR